MNSSTFDNPYSITAAGSSLPDATSVNPNGDTGLATPDRPASERVADAKSMRDDKKTGKQLIGMPVIALSDGTEVGQIHDVIYNSKEGRLIGVTIPIAGGFFGGGKTLLLRTEQMFAMGEDAVTIQSASGLEEISRKADEFGDEAGIAVLGKRLMTDDGTFLGKIVDVLIDRTTRRITAYEVSGGLWGDLMRGQTDVPIEHITAVGNDVVIVPASVKSLIEETTGGLIGHAQLAAEKAGDVRSAAAEKLEDEEIRYSLGKVAAHDVTDDANEPIVRQGDTITEAHIQRALAANKIHALAVAAGRQHAMELGHAASETIKERASAAQEAFKDKQGELLVGKTAGREVVSDEGLIIVPAGATITELHVVAAREAGKLGDLTTAVGADALSTARDKAAVTIDNAKQSLDERRADADARHADEIYSTPAPLTTGTPQTIIHADTVIVQDPNAAVATTTDAPRRV